MRKKYFKLLINPFKDKPSRSYHPSWQAFEEWWQIHKMPAGKEAYPAAIRTKAHDQAKYLFDHFNCTIHYRTVKGNDLRNIVADYRVYLAFESEADLTAYLLTFG